MAHQQKKAGREVVRAADVADAFFAETEPDAEPRQHEQQSVVGVDQFGHLLVFREEQVFHGQCRGSSFGAKMSITEQM